MKLLSKSLSISILVCFLLEAIAPPQGWAQVYSHTVASSTGAYRNTPLQNSSPIFKGIKIYPQEPFRFDFLVDGEWGMVDEKQSIPQPPFPNPEYLKLIKYFMASLAVPEGDLWVNLNPNEPDRIVPEALGQTRMGVDLLSQDYILKQLTSSLMNPEGETGKKFWEKIYERLYETPVGAYCNTPLQNNDGECMQNTIESFNKVWIIPDIAEVYQNGDVAYIVNARLKVMMQEDYLISHNSPQPPLNLQRGSAQRGGVVNDEITNIIRETILPLIEDEVNNSPSFAPLRQIYHSMILAKWYEQHFKNSILGQSYVDRNAVEGIELNSPQPPSLYKEGGKGGVTDPTPIEEIYTQYLSAYKQGASNLIKEEYDPVTQTVTARKYIVGGFNAAQMVVEKSAARPLIANAPFQNIAVRLQPVDEAMLNGRSAKRIIDFAFVALLASFAVNFADSELAWYTYLLKSDPLLTKFLTAFIFYFFGDNYAQRLFSKEETLNWRRIGGSTLIGGVLGIIVYFEYWFLNTQLPIMLDYFLIKSVLHTFGLGFLNNLYFVGAKLVLFEKKRDRKEIWKRVQELYWAGVGLRWGIHLVGFGVIPTDYQMLWVNSWMAIFTVINTAASHGELGVLKAWAFSPVVKVRDWFKGDPAMMAAKKRGPSFMRDEDLENLGIEKQIRQTEHGRRIHWHLDNIFSNFRDAPIASRDFLLARLRNFADTQDEIDHWRLPIQEILADMQGSEEKRKQWKNILKATQDFEDIQKHIRRTFSYLKWHHYRKNSETIYIYKNYKELKMTTVTYTSRDGKVDEEFVPFEKRWSYPELSYPLMHLGRAIYALDRLRQILPPDGYYAAYLARIDKILSQPESKYFLERKELLKAFWKYPNPYLFAEENFEPTPWEKNYHPQENRLIKDLGTIKAKLKTKDRLDLIQRQFQELAGIFSQEGRELWRVDASGHYFYEHLRGFSFNVMQWLPKIDCYIRLALQISGGQYTFAEHDSDGNIKLEEYESPLLRSQFAYGIIPIDVTVINKKAILLSGPNRGGKTTTARDLALAFVLNQAGLPLPAKYARLPVMKNIYTVFPQHEQVQSGYGYFETLLTKIKAISEKVKPGDVVVLDEVPTGTDYQELVAVTVVLLEELIAKGAFVIATSHLKKAFEIIQREHPRDVLTLQQTVKEENGVFVPDFHLQEGVARHSHAISLAKEMKFPQAVVDAAKFYYGKITDADQKIEVFPMDLHMPSEAADAQSDQEEIEPVDSTLFLETFSALYPRDHFAFVRWNDDPFMNTVQRITDTLLNQKKEYETHGGVYEIYFQNNAEFNPKTSEISFDERRAVLDFLSQSDPDNFELMTNGMRTLVKRIEQNIPHSFEKSWIVNFLQNTESELRDFITISGPTFSQNEYLRQRLLALDTFMGGMLRDFQKKYQNWPQPQPDENQEYHTVAMQTTFQQDWRNVEVFLRLSLSPLDEFIGVARSMQKHDLKQFGNQAENEHILKAQNLRPLKSGHFDDAEPFIEGGIEQILEIDPTRPVMVVTGPNSSGKSNLSFNILFNALSVKAGYPVTGEMTTSRFDQIFGIFGGENIVSRRESYFSSILQHYAYLLKHVTKNSLVILDELNGTDNFELAALQLAVLQYLKLVGATVIFNTHIRDGLKEVRQALGFDIRKTDVDFDEKEAKLTYRYTVSEDPDMKAKSYAREITSKYLTGAQMKEVNLIYETLTQGTSDLAMMTSNPGGIDMNALNVETQGTMTPVSLGIAPEGTVPAIQGFRPVIINIRPMMTYQFLGWMDQDNRTVDSDFPQDKLPEKEKLYVKEI